MPYWNRYNCGVASVRKTGVSKVSPEKTVIRDFRPEDMDELYEVDQICFPPGIAYGREELSYYIQQPQAFTLVAEWRKNQIGGFILVQKMRRGIAHLVSIDVRPEARRMRIGTELMHAAEERLWSGEWRALYLETAVDNLAAIQFYKRHGYSVVKTIPRYYRNEIDALLMVKQMKHPAT